MIVLHLLFFITISCCVFNKFSSAVPNYCVDHGFTPSNGSRSPTAETGNIYYEQSLIRYFCNENFRLEPAEPTQVCTLDNTGEYISWKPPYPPTCVELKPCPRVSIEYGQTTEDVYYQGDILGIVCDDGYETSYENDTVCLTTGEWSGQLPYCTEKQCPNPTEIENGNYGVREDMRHLVYSSLDQSWPPGYIVLYACDDGYILEPSYQVRRVCRKGQWSGQDPLCVRSGCDRPSEARPGSFYYPYKSHYDTYDVITYRCFSGVHPEMEGVTRTCQMDHTWSGTPPLCTDDISTVSMPYTKEGNVFCTTPLPVNHGSVLCCGESTEVPQNITDDPTYCCPVNGVVQFVCDTGYAIHREPTQWICGIHGEWILVGYPQYGVPPSQPTCQGNDTRLDQPALSDDMLKPVLGTAAGVLLILSAAIVVAFCRPKLKNMKRRWREQREDEDELIIDGRRILLPSYEEATSSPHDPYLQLARPSDDTPGPSNLNPSTNDGYCPSGSQTSRDDVSCILEVHAAHSASANSRLSSSSDEGLLVPDSVPENGIVADTPSSPGSPVVLRAGTLQNSSILINVPDAEVTEPVRAEKVGVERSDLSLESCEEQKDAVKLYPCEDREIVDVFESTNSCVSSYDAMDLISPRNTTSRSDDVLAHPLSVVGSDVHDLLTYPIGVELSDDSGMNDRSFTIDIVGDAGGCEGGDRAKSTTESDNAPSEVDINNDTIFERNMQEESPPPPVPSDHVCLVTSSSHASRQHCDDMTGSTSV